MFHLNTVLMILDIDATHSDQYLTYYDNTIPWM